MLVLSEKGEVLQSATYSTNSPGQSDKLVRNLEDIQPGRFIILIGLVSA